MGQADTRMGARRACAYEANRTGCLLLLRQRRQGQGTLRCPGAAPQARQVGLAQRNPTYVHASLTFACLAFYDSRRKVARVAARQITVNPSEHRPPHDVIITHPERVVYPADGITKGEVAAYYRAVMPRL